MHGSGDVLLAFLCADLVIETSCPLLSPDVRLV